MNYRQGINHLKAMINETLRPLVGKKCVLFDVPFYKNIGDVLIWQGELSFIKENDIKLLDFCNYHTYVKKEIDKETCILFQGGGNIGDLYHEHVEFLLRIIKDYPDNRIVVLSQTVFYHSEKAFQIDFDTISKHNNLYFVTRDYVSYKKVQCILGDNTLVLPDMAFCIGEKFLVDKSLKTVYGKLYIKRNDKEAPLAVRCGKYDLVSDWPCFERRLTRNIIVNTLYDRMYRYLPFLRNYIRERWKEYASEKFRYLMIKDGIKFISPYELIESERLHGCILSILLGKKVVIVNNSYGKNKNFYDAWLKDFDSVTLKMV